MLSRFLAPLALTLPAFGGTVSHPIVLPSYAIGATGNARVPGFDRDLGHLDSVTIEGTINTTATASLENVTAAPIAGPIDFASCVVLQGPGCAWYVSTSQHTNLSLPAYDGTTDYAGTSGVALNINASANYNQANGVTAFSRLAWSAQFVDLPVSTLSSLTTQPTWLPQDVENLAQVAGSNDLVLTIRYDFTPYPESFCGAAETAAHCPCSPPLGSTRGCPSPGALGGAGLLGVGSASLSGGGFFLTAHALPTSTVGLLFEGTQANYMGTNFGAGVRCVGGQVRRLAVSHPNSAGMISYGLTGTSMQPTAPGFRCYQFWYRQPPAGCTSATFNLTNAVGTVWTP